MRDVYLCYDRIFSGYIGMLPDRPIIIPVEVRLNIQRNRTSVTQTDSATAVIRASKYTPDGTTNLRKILNKRCAQQKCYKNASDSLRIMLSS